MNNSDPKLEVCVASFKGLMTAREGGADGI